MIRVLFVGSGTTFREKVQLPKAEAVLASYNTQHRHLNLGCSATVHNKNNALVARAVRVTRQVLVVFFLQAVEHDVIVHRPTFHVKNFFMP